MSNPQITVQNLSKTYHVPVRDAGLFASMRSLLTRSYRDVNAVRDISFSIEKGEIVGFLGPNGAGKTTTLKMLAGLLYPTSGEVCVAGFTPWERKQDYLRRISMVLGTVGDVIHSGGMNLLLLRPLSPHFSTLATEIAGKVVCMIFVIPIAAMLAILLHPSLHTTPNNVLLFFVTLLLAWLLRFFWGYWLALFAFWMTRSDALLSIQDTLIFLLAGQVAPIVLLPGILRNIAVLLPFRYMVSFPLEILLGHLSAPELLTGLAYQISWGAIAFVLFITTWRRGLRYYVAIGG